MTFMRSLSSRTNFLSITAVTTFSMLSAVHLQARSQVFTLESLIEMGQSISLSIEGAKAQSQAARAALTTAQTYPNPEIDFNTGPFRPTTVGSQLGGASGSGYGAAIAQRIENPSLRQARSSVAQTNIRSTDLNLVVLQNDISALIKVRYFEVLKRGEELAAAKEELQLTEQIRERIRVRTSTGESPRFDLIRASTEVALATKEVERITARLSESRALLQQAVGTALPDSFQTTGDFYRKIPTADLNQIRASALTSNPVIKKSEVDATRARQQIELEQRSIMPSVSLRLMQDREPEISSTRLGISLAIPLWDKRKGPIDEARALAVKADLETQQRRFELNQALSAGWQQYQSALKTVQAYEGVGASVGGASGILTQAKTVVDIAEAAYRFGERGILEYLDARRQFRLARGELINARFDLHVAAAELERLAAQELRSIE